METVNIHEAKTHLSRLVHRVAQGQSFIIAKAGKPMAKVVPYKEGPERKKKRIGFLKDAGFSVPDDFDDIGREEIEASFSGKS